MLAQAISNLDAWLQTMRQPGGYGGPVAHWWQNRYCYTGPGLDWRYEGLLIGYSSLFVKTGESIWNERLRCAAHDLITGQQLDGSYRASNFEMNPLPLGTPHEAAATLGLLTALPHLAEQEQGLEVARRNLNNLISKLWDSEGSGFNDKLGVPGRVPNKLATLAQSLLSYVAASGHEEYVRYARAALEDVLRYQVLAGQLAGAVHQYAPHAKEGDGRFFPFYNSRCIPPLVVAAQFFGESRYLEAAQKIALFLQRTMTEDGSWPQVIYATGKRAQKPHWVAGVADILLAYHVLDERLPKAALDRLLAHQLKSGGFPTAQGFADKSGRRASTLPDYRDVTPVVGWNDKVLRLFSALLPTGESLPKAKIGEVDVPILLWEKAASFRETPHCLSIAFETGELLYRWRKSEPWAHVQHLRMDTR